MDGATLAAHLPALTSFLLEALDVRRQQQLSAGGGAPPWEQQRQQQLSAGGGAPPWEQQRQHQHQPLAPVELRAAEASAVAALVELTLKLSELQFKPLFLRLLEWAAPPATAAASPAGQRPKPKHSSQSVAVAAVGEPARLITLFVAAAALGDRLRSVFVPYFRHLVDLAISHLASQPPAPPTPAVIPGARQSASAGGASAEQDKQQGLGGHRDAKRRKKGEAAALAAPPPPSMAELGRRQELLAVQQHWVLRSVILRALHRCFAYDSVGFVDGDVVSRPGLSCSSRLMFSWFCCCVHTHPHTHPSRNSRRPGQARAADAGNPAGGPPASRRRGGSDQGPAAAARVAGDRRHRRSRSQRHGGRGRGGRSSTHSDLRLRGAGAGAGRAAAWLGAGFRAAQPGGRVRAGSRGCPGRLGGRRQL
jgi:hypothetical protein